jgi:outer membrane protein assembly factor BamE (lipoprotein component of BamABCDE complex)
MQWGALVLAAVAILTMPGCKREFANRNLAQLKINMTQKEVESILGSPDRTEKADVDLETQKKTMAITKYYYNQHGETVIVQFQNGRLVSQPAQLKE